MLKVRLRNAAARRCWLLVLFIFSLGAFIEPVRAADDDLIDQGRDLFNDVCAPCHGRDMVNTSALTFDLRKFPKDAAERFVGSVLNGKGNGMPPWRDKVSDDDVKALWAFVQSGGG
jgi:mono/diheme cytochrome c family protein